MAALSNTLCRLAMVLMLWPLPSMAMELTFFGEKPALPEGRPLRVDAGVEPGARVTFDTSDATVTVLRPARADEQASAEQPLYVFEWQRRNVARFYPVYPSAVIERLEREYAVTGATPQGKGLESLIMVTFLHGGGVLRSCIQPGQRMPQELTIYLAFPAGSAEPSETVVLPEGAIAECVLAAASSHNPYPSAPVRFVAKGKISLVDSRKPPAIAEEKKKAQARPR